MRYAGLDLAAKPSNTTGLALLESTKAVPQLLSLKNLSNDNEIVEALKNVDYLAIDAPLIDGAIPKGLRAAEKQLINLGLRVMTPSFLEGLVKRAQKIISKLPKSVKIIEVHPRSSALMLGLSVEDYWLSILQLEKLIDLDGIDDFKNKHQYDALVAAYTAFLHRFGYTRNIGENGSYISLPRSSKIKLAVLDMDGTLTRPQSSWEHIHRQLGTWENGGEIYLKKFLAGTISYEEFARLDTAEWNGVSLQKIQKIASSVEYMPGAEELMHHLKDNNIQTAVISGGLSVIADKVIEDFGVKRIFVNDLIAKDGLLTGEVKINVSFNGKLTIFKKLLKELKIKPYQVLSVGDTNGDAPLFKNSGLAVAINPITPDVAEVADITVKSLAEIIPLVQGSG